jgi:hypothetical protein
MRKGSLANAKEMARVVNRNYNSVTIVLQLIERIFIQVIEGDNGPKQQCRNQKRYDKIIQRFAVVGLSLLLYATFYTFHFRRGDLRKDVFGIGVNFFGMDMLSVVAFKLFAFGNFVLRDSVDHVENMSAHQYYFTKSYEIKDEMQNWYLHSLLSLFLKVIRLPPRK